MQIIDVNIMFLLNIFFFIYRKYVKYLNRVCCGFYFLMHAKTNFFIHIWESWKNKIFKTHDYFSKYQN